ncbi:uncharacterized transposon-derived protein F54H12.3 [Trichonephila clavipes]|uniref:Uncharacterized transposon-derived protein F54H12.3 n=1 Tax=Trichonephila clavipes TaxID=2585209 RepID=A0A8X6WDS9_TRICX|nr:uncharacterized transposon-derived protein F54H12.3 [Trichonephila clavipes]
MHQDLAAFYENPEVPNSFGGVEALHRSVKGKYSKKDVKHWLSQKDAYTLHKPVRHKFQRNRVFVSDIDRQFQADLVDMQSLAEFNKGYKYLLTCIDLFSKFAWAVPLKDKFGKSVKSGLEIIFKERKPKVLQTDAGYEQNWRRELFIVFEIVQRIPIVYRLKDLQGEEIKGTYYEAELQKVVDSGFYPVENVIKQRKRGGITEYFVKFLGYPEKFNEWVTDIQKNRRDQSQITHLGRQLYPRKVKFFQECYADATSKPYGYLLIDLKPETDESLRVRTGFNGRRKTILYLQVLQKYTHFSNENRRESEPVPNAASLSENQETESLKENLKESVVKTEKEVFEDEIFRIVPARYKEKAKIFSSF